MWLSFFLVRWIFRRELLKFLISYGYAHKRWNISYMLNQKPQAYWLTQIFIVGGDLQVTHNHSIEKLDSMFIVQTKERIILWRTNAENLLILRMKNEPNLIICKIILDVEVGVLTTQMERHWKFLVLPIKDIPSDFTHQNARITSFCGGKIVVQHSYASMEFLYADTIRMYFKATIVWL